MVLKLSEQQGQYRIMKNSERHHLPYPTNVIFVGYAVRSASIAHPTVVCLA